MDYQIQRDGDDICYTNQERTAFVDGKAGDWTLTIYSHPNGLHAWDKQFHTVQKEKATDAAIHWVTDGSLPAGINEAAKREKTGQ